MALTERELLQVRAAWMREISDRGEHCPLTKPELLTVLQQLNNGEKVTVEGDPTIDRQKAVYEVVQVGVTIDDQPIFDKVLVEVITLPNTLDQPQLDRLTELLTLKAKSGDVALPAEPLDGLR